MADGTYEPSADEKEFRDFVNPTLGQLSSKTRRTMDSGLLEKEDMLALHRAFAEELRKKVELFVDGGNVRALLRSTYREFGRWEAREQEIDSRSSIVTVKPDQNKVAHELDFDLDRITLTADQERLITDVRRALTVVLVVVGPDKATTPLPWPFHRRNREQDRPPDVREWAERRSDYIRRLGRIARTGLLLPERVRLANTGVLHDYRSFFVMAAASCAGTWLSFSLRRAVLGFTDLVSPEADRLNPLGRLLFVVGLTSVIGIFLSTDLIDLKLGNVPFATRMRMGLWAVLLGCVCGIAERAIASVVSRRSEDFVGRLGGQVPPVPVRDVKSGAIAGAGNGNTSG